MKVGTIVSDSKREQRKNDHVEIAMAQTDAPRSDFDKIRFVHHSIPDIDVSDVDLTSHLTDFTLDYPIYILSLIHI